MNDGVIQSQIDDVNAKVSLAIDEMRGLEGRVAMMLEEKTLPPDEAEPVPLQDFGEDSPFRGFINAAGNWVHIHQGYVFAGAYGAFNFPESGGYWNVSFGADGVWVVYMSVVVDSEYGTFTAADQPHINTFNSTSGFNNLNTDAQTDIIIGRALVSGGVIVQWRQDLWDNIYCVVWNEKGSSNENNYTCSLKVPVWFPDVKGTVTVPGPAPAVKSGNTSDNGGPWPWV
mgnify:FL=1